MGAAFQNGAQTYAKVRPLYPEPVVDFVTDPTSAGGQISSAVDVGAGTGQFTGLLAGRGIDTVAVDPSAAMLEQLSNTLPGTHTVQAAAEETGLPANSVDLVVCAQAWHWVDPQRGLAEAARILRTAGRLAVVWNQLDTSVAWVHRLTRIMHSGDVHAAQPDQLRMGKPFGEEDHLRVEWSETTTPEELFDLMATRSYWLRATEKTHERMRTNLSWYLYEHLCFQAGQELNLPYVTVAWRAENQLVD